MCFNLNKHRLLKRSLYSCLALMTILPFTAGAMQVIHARPAHAKATQQVKAPWKKAWNKYAADESGYASVYIYPIKGRIKTNDWYKNINKRYDVGNHKYAGTVAGWNRFYKGTHNKASLYRNIVSYPAYQHLSDSSFNAREEEHGHSWYVDVPYYNVIGLEPGKPKSRPSSDEPDFKRAELVANLPMEDLTANQEQALGNWAEPVKNGYRLLETFHDWMKENHNSPQIFVNHEKFSYDQPNGLFKPTVGTNGYGESYAYNSATHKYQRISNNKAMSMLMNRASIIQKVIDQYQASVKKTDDANPLLDSEAKHVVNHFAQQPGVSQAQAYKDAYAYFTDTTEGQKLLYSADRAKTVQNTSEERANKESTVNIDNLIALETTPELAKVAPDQQANLARYLLAHPKLLQYLVNKYHAQISGVAADNSNQAKAIADSADRYAKQGNHAKTAPKGIISTNPAVIKELSIMHNQTKALAAQQGIAQKKLNQTLLNS